MNIDLIAAFCRSLALALDLPLLIRQDNRILFSSSLLSPDAEATFTANLSAVGSPYFSAGQLLYLWRHQEAGLTVLAGPVAATAPDLAALSRAF
ncbi:MAG: hypothetical protein K5707_04445 [Clostridia bacterium]|nr:hypothetical protein [Clostridia bacterium]